MRRGEVRLRMTNEPALKTTMITAPAMIVSATVEGDALSLIVWTIWSTTGMFVVIRVTMSLMFEFKLAKELYTEAVVRGRESYVNKTRIYGPNGVQENGAVDAPSLSSGRLCSDRRCSTGAV